MKTLSKKEQLVIRIREVISMRYQLEYETGLLVKVQNKELKKKDNFFKKPDHLVLQNCKERIESFTKMHDMLNEYLDVLQKDLDYEQ